MNSAAVNRVRVARAAAAPSRGRGRLGNPKGKPCDILGSCGGKRLITGGRLSTQGVRLG